MRLYLEGSVSLPGTLKAAGNLRNSNRSRSTALLSQWAYPWMQAQMRACLGGSAGDTRPWWAHYGRDPQPLGREHQEVLLVLEVPDEEVLLSDFHLWERHVLEGFYLAYTQREFDEWAASHPSHFTLCNHEDRAAMGRSWQRIFEWDQPTKFDLTWQKMGHQVQACFEVLRWDEVQEVVENPLSDLLDRT